MRIPLLALLVMVSLVGIIAPVSGQKVGENWETWCKNGFCSTTIYPYQRYFLNESRGWERINENLGQNGCDRNYDYCVTRNLYEVHAKEYPDTAESVRYKTQGYEFNFQPFTLNYRNSLNQLEQLDTINNARISVSGNEFSYPGAFLGFSLRYVYLPGSLKQELIIGQKPPEPASYILAHENVTLDMDFLVSFDRDIDIWVNGEKWDKKNTRKTSGRVEFRNATDTLFYLPEPWIFDGDYDGILGEYELKKGGNKIYVILKTPYEWLHNKTLRYPNYTQTIPTVYPIRIDPSVSLTSSSINADGLVQESGCGATYGRNEVTDTLFIGHRKTVTGSPPVVSETCRRSYIFWDVSSIPEYADIQTTKIFLRTHTIGDHSNDINTFTQMELNSTNYPNTASGNQLFYDDAGQSNGTIFYYEWHAESANNVVTFSINASDDFVSKLRSGLKWWGYGIDWKFNDTVHTPSDSYQRYHSSESSTAAFRPQLEINWTSPIELFLDSPQNITYENRTIDLNITAIVQGGVTIAEYWYEMNSNGTNITFTPNETIEALDNSNFIQVWVNNSDGAVNTTNVTFFVSVPVEVPTIIFQIDSPMNITYTNFSIGLNVTIIQNTSPIDVWWYNWNGTNVTFVPNITINFSEGFRNITVWANMTDGTSNASQVFFTVRAKRFLTELYITHQLMALGLLLMGIRKQNKLIYALLSMAMFFSLAVLGSGAEKLFTNAPYVSVEATMFNLALGIIAFLYIIFAYLTHLSDLKRGGSL